MATSLTIFSSLLGGIIPSLLWLWFWLQEDKKRPEPRGRIAATFLLGMVAVIAVLPLEKMMFGLFSKELAPPILTVWAIIEELMKFLAAYFAALRFADADEPIDFVIYMVTAALGFSALENSFFLANADATTHLAQSIISGNMRFLGATLLHTITSATIGTFMAICFYKDKKTKRLGLGAGIMFAIALHTLFNFFIIHLGQRVFWVFGAVWIFIIILILIFEKVKSLDHSENLINNPENSV